MLAPGECVALSDKSTIEPTRVASAGSRLPSIDAVRGLIMALMVVDHVRDYFHAFSQLHSPTDLEVASTAVFLTRWITHICAPGFVFLAGISIRLMSAKRTRQEISRFLLVRGLMLVVMEFTVVRFAWDFTLRPYFYAQIIWTLGWCMVLMSLFTRVGHKARILFVLTLVALVQVAPWVPWLMQSAIWRVLYSGGRVGPQGAFFFIGYPVIRWVGVMIAGFWFGELYELDASRRKRILLLAGMGLLALFAILRSATNLDPFTVAGGSARVATLTFINVTKLPASIPYLLLMVGLVLLLLAYFERNRWCTSTLAVLGSAPLVFYVLHIFLAHALALVVTLLRGQDFRLVLPFMPMSKIPASSNFGFDLPVVYLVSMAVVAALYPVCRRIGILKRERRYSFLRYL